ncbi:MAG: hypothetical protein IIC25_06690 [Chloroflexi bacterium]|nr:hypothetical protein [Chloroflexota bacterium]
MTSIDLGADGVTVTTSHGEYNARALVGADGSTGMVRRAVGLQDRGRVARLLEALTPEPLSAPEFQEQFANFDFTPMTSGLQGYYWEFPSLIDGEPFMNRGVFDSRIISQRPRADLKAILARTTLSTLGLVMMLYGLHLANQDALQLLNHAAYKATLFLCAGIIGYRALKLSGLVRGGRLGLFGFGASAHLVLQIARSWQCQTYVFTRSEDHRRLALDLGAAWTGGAEDDPGVPLDAAISFAPAGWLIPAALKWLDRGATLAVNAVHASDVPAFPYELLYWERTVLSVANYTREDAHEFLALAGEGGLRVQVEEYPLLEANDALVRLKRSEVAGAAVLVP